MFLTGAFALPPQARAGAAADFQNFVYTSAGGLPGAKRLLARHDISGVQVVYNWKLLEVSKDRYDFSKVENDLAFVKSLGKKMFIQVQDRFFSPEAKYVPNYLLSDPAYGGGIVPQMDNPGENKQPVLGWVAQQWNPSVRHRFQKLLQALAEKFDGRVYGINLPETAIDIDAKRAPGFTCGKYFKAEMENIAFARRVIKRSYVVQYVNFWPCEWNGDRDYMGRLFDFAARNNVGLGGPDIVPDNKAQMHNSYPLFFKYKGKLSLVAMAVQEPTLTYRNPKTGKPYSREEFENFGRSYLGANIIFWSVLSPWLK